MDMSITMKSSLLDSRIREVFDFRVLLRDRFGVFMCLRVLLSFSGLLIGQRAQWLCAVSHARPVDGHLEQSKVLLFCVHGLSW